MSGVRVPCRPPLCFASSFFAALAAITFRHVPTSSAARLRLRVNRFGEDHITTFMPRFPKAEVKMLSDDYSYSAQDTDASAAGRRARDQGYYDGGGFRTL